MAKQTPVDPLTPLAPYLGGKRNLARVIIQRIDAIPHDCYAEVFVGMAGVFLRRHQAPKSEVINDYSRDVATFFRVLQRHYVAFMDMMRFQLTTRVEFERLVATDPETLTDLERAARFLYLQNTAFGGKVSGRNFGVAPDRPARFDITKLGTMLEEVHSRLARVVIECLSYERFITRYDRPGTLFYLDPPYWGNENDYGKDMFGRQDFMKLVILLHQIEGRFLLSINDRPEVRDLFAGFNIEAVETTYTVAKGGAKRVGELIISNNYERLNGAQTGARGVCKPCVSIAQTMCRAIRESPAARGAVCPPPCGPPRGYFSTENAVRSAPG